MRLNYPFQVLVIAPWAPLLARARPREGRYGRIVAALLIYAINFNLIGVGESWLSHGIVGEASVCGGYTVCFCCLAPDCCFITTPAMAFACCGASRRSAA